MLSKRSFKPTRSLAVLLLAVTVGLLPVTLVTAQTPSQTQNNWSKPLNLSAHMNDAWFPDISVDGQGRAHIVFLGSDLFSEKSLPTAGKYDKDYYQQISAQGIPAPNGPTNIAVSPFGWVARAAVVTDNKRGLLHMLARFKTSLYYMQAPIGKANDPLAWSEPRNLDDHQSSYYSDIAVDTHGTLHATWTEVRGTEATKLRQVVIYRQSTDLGVTWSFPQEIAVPTFAATRVVLKVDAHDGLHISWDDGYDNQTAQYDSTYGAYSHSLDGGKTWSAPIVFGSEKDPVAQTVVTPFGNEGVMLAWRVLKEQRIDYMVSNDQGVTWSSPQTVPNITARKFTVSHQFDRYYLAADGAGRVHLAAIGVANPLLAASKDYGMEKSGDLGVFHAVWQNGEWSEPELISDATGFPEYPRMAIGPDRLHIVWFVRNKPENEDFKNIYYSSLPYDSGINAQPIAQFEPPKPTPIPTLLAAPAPTPVTILPPVNNTPGQSWLQETYMTVLVSLLPALALGLVAIGLVWLRGRRKPKIR